MKIMKIMTYKEVKDVIVKEGCELSAFPFEPSLSEEFNEDIYNQRENWKNEKYIAIMVFVKVSDKKGGSRKIHIRLEDLLKILTKKESEESNLGRASFYGISKTALDVDGNRLELRAIRVEK